MNQGSSDAVTKERMQEAPDATAGHTLSIVGGDDQTVPLVMTDLGFPMATFDPVAAEPRDADGTVLTGLAVFEPVRILLKDTEGRRAPDVRVTFEAVAPGAMKVQISAEGDTATVISDADGVATLNLIGGKGIVCSRGAGEFKVIVTPDN